VRTSLRLRIAVACVLSSLAVVVATAPAEASRTDCVPEAGWPQQDPNLASQVVALVNEYRARLGLSQLGVSQSLTNAAAWKASELAVDVPATGGAAFSHEDYGTGRTPDARLQACGYGDSFGENIALGQNTPRAVMDAWIASDGHRRNLEYPYWTAIGVGAATGSWGPGWVQDFGVSLPDPIATPSPSLVAPSATTPTPATPLTTPIQTPLVSSAPGAPVAAAATAPDVTIMARPRTRTRKRTVRIRWAISGVAQQVSCSLNGRALSGCGPNGRTLRRVRRGRHVFTVTVSGPAGTDTQQIRWRVVRPR
jgi:uncharacterized protein YkwD